MALSPCLAALAGSLPACAEEAPGEVATRPDVTGPDDALGQVSAHIEWNFCDEGDNCKLRGSISLREVACSASVSCVDELLFDDELNRQPSLVTGFGCMFPQGQPADAMLGFHPVVRCYTGGIVDQPGTWSPSVGIVPDLEPDDQLFFAEADNGAGATPGSGRSWLDHARLVSTMEGYAFCELRAFGFVAFSDAGDGQPRRAYHEMHAPVVEWRAIIEAPPAAPYQCHTGPNGQTWVRRRVARSVTHDLPDETVKGTFPVSHDIIMIDDSEGLRAVVVQGSTFPEEPDALPIGYLERTLDGTGIVTTEWTCANTGAGGVVDSVAVYLAGGLGTILVERQVTDTFGTRAWDCEREPSGECHLVIDTEIPAQSPCLLPYVL